jgi:hypothetical protein
LNISTRLGRSRHWWIVSERRRERARVRDNASQARRSYALLGGASGSCEVEAFARAPRWRVGLVWGRLEYGLGVPGWKLESHFTVRPQELDELAGQRACAIHPRNFVLATEFSA